MKNSTYNSVPVIASIIGSKSRKAMYLTNVTSLDGSRIYKDKWVPTSWGTTSKTTIEWDYDSQSLVEYPMKKVSESMVVDRYDTSNVSCIKAKLIDGVVVEYLQLKDRYIIHIPTWLIKNFEERYTVSVKDDDLMHNDNNYESVAEQTAYDSVVAETFSYITRDTMNFEVDSLTQWEIDNPEYAS